MMRILRTDEVTERTGLSRSSIWRLERDGVFPARRQISSKAVGWLSSDIERWIESLPKATPSPEMADRVRREAQGQ
jgi:prophage regulatory protein